MTNSHHDLISAFVHNLDLIHECDEYEFCAICRLIKKGYEILNSLDQEKKEKFDKV